MTNPHPAELLLCCLGNFQDFARKYKKDINANPVFRNEFQKMCRQIGKPPQSYLMDCISSTKTCRRRTVIAVS